MAEWLKAHAWKACMLQKGIEGSNPSLSASLRSERSAERRLPRQSDNVAASPERRSPIRRETKKIDPKAPGRRPAFRWQSPVVPVVIRIRFAGPATPLDKLFTIK